MAVLAASMNADYQDSCMPLVLRRASCTEWAVAEEEVGRGAESLRPFPWFPSPSPNKITSSWVLGTFFLLPVISSGPYLSAGSFRSLLLTELQGLKEARVGRRVLKKLLILGMEVEWKGA